MGSISRVVAFVFCLLFLMQPAKSFIEFEQIWAPFKKTKPRVVKVINQEGVPLLIAKAEVRDKGSERTKELNGVYNDYKVIVQNNSGKDVLAYRIAWILKLPFQNWVEERIEVNSIHPLPAGASQSLNFKMDKYFRDDAYYYVEVMKVQYTDESIWEAPESEEVITRQDKVKQEIESIQEGSIEDLSLDEIKQQVNGTNGASLSK